MTTKELIDLLYDLSRHVIERFSKHLESGKIRIVKNIYTRYKVEDFRYDTKSGANFNLSIEYVSKDELDTYTLNEFIDELSNDDIFRRTMEAIMKLYGVPKDRARVWLDRFVDRLVREYHSEKLNDRELVYLISTFINELDGNPIDWHIEIWLDGLFMEIPMIELDKGVILRAPRKEDLEYGLALDMPLPAIPPLEPGIPSAIIELDKKLRLGPEIDPYIKKLLLLLQLYKLCSVYEVETRYIPIGVLSIGSVSRSTKQFVAMYECVLTEEDAKLVPKFIREIGPRIPLDEKTSMIRVDNYIGVALARYQDVLLKPEPIPNRIAYAIFGLEALYLRGGERGELSQRLAQRVAKVIAKVGKGRGKEVMQSIKRAYEIRSAFVHGEPLKSSKRSVKDLLDKVAEYLRISLLIFMLASRAKDGLIELIDDALLDRDSDRELEQLLKQIPYL